MLRCLPPRSSTLEGVCKHPPPPVKRPLIPHGAWALEAAIVARLQELQGGFKCSWIRVNRECRNVWVECDLLLVEWQQC